jgi:phage nucleotide-binding protein
MKLIKANDEVPASENIVKLNVLIYGHPGVGKTTFAARSSKVLIADAENGTTMLRLNGIKKADVAKVETWEDIDEIYKLAKSGQYEVVVIDPIGELLDKLLTSLKKTHGSKDGQSLSIGGWGVAKEKFRFAMRSFRDLGVHVVLVAHTSEKKEEETLLVRPKLQANLDEDICAMMDVVGYLRVAKDPTTKETKRRLYVAPNDKYYGKDRSGTLPEYLDEPTFDKLCGIVQEKSGLHFAAAKSLDKAEDMGPQEKVSEVNKDPEVPFV